MSMKELQRVIEEEREREDDNINDDDGNIKQCVY